jgi:hypothetical protein
MRKACINCKNYSKISQIGGNCLLTKTLVVDQNGNLKDRFKKVLKYERCNKFNGKDLPNKTINNEVD